MLKDIMVLLDLTPACKGRIEAACTLAKQHEASLTGLYLYAATRLQNPAQQVAKVREMFERCAHKAGVECAWLDENLLFTDAGADEVVGYYGSFTDLLVISQPAAGEADKDQGVLISPERLLACTSRPVLMVPRSGVFPRLGERIMVAWKAGPKASRATHDALPLLRAASQVNMVSIGKATYSPEEAALLARYLARHQVVRARVEVIPPGDLDVGDTLLNLVAEEKIDLVILGVHIVKRHGRLGLGAVGGHLLGQMTVPLLLSH